MQNSQSPIIEPLGSEDHESLLSPSIIESITQSNLKHNQSVKSHLPQQESEPSASTSLSQTLSQSSSASSGVSTAPPTALPPH